MKHLHILGISGTFMSALAILAKEAGYQVSGCDANCYPPVSDLLTAKGINWVEGYSHSELALSADEVIVGNAIKRGMPVLEAVMSSGKPYTSGPQWLAEHVLSRYKVIAVSGTHGKTTTTSMLAWILTEAGLDPGFLIGGVASNFNTSAHLGKGSWFVIEADEYDSAFFDKRPKFMHYRPQIAILNNLEFDHADIYADLSAIQTQFHYLLRTIPAEGLALYPLADEAIKEVLDKGRYSRVESMSAANLSDWKVELLEKSGSHFAIHYKNEQLAEINWKVLGQINCENALAAFAAAVHAGVDPQKAAAALESFIPVKRRLEIKGQKKGITVYDDFAHHPTAIAKTIEALSLSKRHKRILVIMEFASYTMRTGVHAEQMGKALARASKAYILKPSDFDLESFTQNWECGFKLLENTQAIIAEVSRDAREGDAILIMSNRGFENIHQRMLELL